MSSTEKMHPFIPFMKFLEGEREAVARIAEVQPRRKKRNSFHAKNQGWNQGTKKYCKCAYPSHRKDVISHTTEECKEFHKLPVKEKYELLKQVNACFGEIAPKRITARAEIVSTISCYVSTRGLRKKLATKIRQHERKPMFRKAMLYPYTRSIKQQSVELIRP